MKKKSLVAFTLVLGSLTWGNPSHNSSPECPSPQEVKLWFEQYNIKKIEAVEPSPIRGICEVKAILGENYSQSFYITADGKYLIPSLLKLGKAQVKILEKGEAPFYLTENNQLINIIGKVSFQPSEIKGLDYMILTQGYRSITVGYTDKQRRYLIRRVIPLRVSQKELKELDKYVAFQYGNNPNAPTVYFITDPECPFCKRTEPIIEKLVKEGKLNVKVVLFPLPFHKNAFQKSVSIICDKKGWEGLVSGYISPKWNSEECQAVRNQVKKGMQLLESLGVSGTPTFINEKGLMRSGLPTDIEEFKKFLGIKE
jgi:thiol-disulfide isomerase/thioredoxin